MIWEVTSQKATQLPPGFVLRRSPWHSRCAVRSQALGRPLWKGAEVPGPQHWLDAQPTTSTDWQLYKGALCSGKQILLPVVSQLADPTWSKEVPSLMSSDQSADS